MSKRRIQSLELILSAATALFGVALTFVAAVKLDVGLMAAGTVAAAVALALKLHSSRQSDVPMDE